jgi:hypothetical protein
MMFEKFRKGDVRSFSTTELIRYHGNIITEENVILEKQHKGLTIYDHGLTKFELLIIQY